MGTIAITGGASGIGASISRRLYRRPNTQLWLADIDGGALNEIGGELPGTQVRVLDVTVPEQVEEFVGKASSEEPLDAVIACAGVSCPGIATEIEPRRWKRTLEVNALGVMHLVRSALVPMQAQGCGTIIVVASASGRLFYAGEPAYVASKHAVVAFCSSVRKEIVGSGVRMCIIEPGLVDTPMARSHPAIDEVLGQVTPLEPDDVARVAEFMLEQPAHCSINEVLIRPTNQDL